MWKASTRRSNRPAARRREEHASLRASTVDRPKDAVKLPLAGPFTLLDNPLIVAQPREASMHRRDWLRRTALGVSTAAVPLLTAGRIGAQPANKPPTGGLKI